MTNIKTLDINALEWFDKINGNSYFAAIITLNYGMPDSKTVKVPFNYGYGDHYVTEAKQELIKLKYIPDSNAALWSYCKDNNIILRTSKRPNCKKGN